MSQIKNQIIEGSDNGVAFDGEEMNDGDEHTISSEENAEKIVAGAVAGADRHRSKAQIIVFGFDSDDKERMRGAPGQFGRRAHGSLSCSYLFLHGVVVAGGTCAGLGTVLGSQRRHEVVLQSLSPVLNAVPHAEGCSERTCRLMWRSGRRSTEKERSQFFTEDYHFSAEFGSRLSCTLIQFKEIYLLSQFGDENIVRYVGTNKENNMLCIFLELVTKGSLASLYRKYCLKDSQVLAYTRLILSGLKYFHDRKVVHRDIKCANILVDANGSAKLAYMHVIGDWGTSSDQVMVSSFP
ncbi:hypothetical protein S245_059340, partial [Arachis hypogaea]